MLKPAVLVLFLIVLGAAVLIDRVLYRKAHSMARERFPERVQEPRLKSGWGLGPREWWPPIRFLLFRQYENLGDPELPKRYDAHRRAFALYLFLLLCALFVLPWASGPATSPVPRPAIEAIRGASDTAARFEAVFNRLIMATMFGGAVLLVLIAVAGANVGAYAGTVLSPGEGNGPPSRTWSF